MERFVGGSEGDVKVGDQGVDVVVTRGHQCEGRLMMIERELQKLLPGNACRADDKEVKQLGRLTTTYT